MRIELLSFQSFPNAAKTLALVRRCVARLQLEAAIVERCGDVPSPSLRGDGRDVMEQAVATGPACRSDLPTEDRAAVRGGSA